MAANYLGSKISLNGSDIVGITSVSYEPGRTAILPQTDGRGTATLAGVTRCQPVLSIVSLSVGAVLSAMEASGSDLPYKTLSSTGLIWTDRKVSANAPTIDASSVHEQAAAALGVIAVTGIEAQDGEPATISAVCYPTSSNGTTDPVAFSQVAAPADVTTITPWILDSVTLDSTAIAEVIGVSLGISIDWQIEFGSKVFPQMARPRRSDWTLTIRHRDRTVPRVKLDKDSNASFVLKSIDSGGPTRGSGTVTVTVTGLIHQGGASQGQDPTEITTIVRGRFKTSGSVMPGTWAVA
jgi:hypothetical protein